MEAGTLISVKSQIVNFLGFAGPTVSVTAAQVLKPFFFFFSGNAATGNM